MAADALIEAFEAERPHLVRVAYGTLGSVTDAEDVVQEAWLRFARQEHPEAIVDLRAWLTRVVGRLALDALRRARATRETYTGPWLPEPVVGAVDADPADRVSLDEEITTALLLVLERLSPAERSAFVLHDVFSVPFAEVAEVVGRTPGAVRQLASRARRQVAEGRPLRPVAPDEQRRVVEAFAVACGEGDLEGLLALLDADVVWVSDGGGHVSALRKPLTGAGRVAKALLGFARVAPRRAALVPVNGLPGILLEDPTGVVTVMTFAVSDGRIVALESQRNPEKLTHVAFP